MNVKIAFDDFERIESLEVYVEDHITSILEKFGEEAFTSCRVKLEKCNSRTHTQHLVFGCDINVTSRKYPAIHIRKEADDIHRAIHEVGEKLKNLLSRQHKSQLSRRHEESRVAATAGDPRTENS